MNLSDAEARMVREALAGMIAYSHMSEMYQDEDSTSVPAAEAALAMLDAKAGEQEEGV